MIKFSFFWSMTHVIRSENIIMNAIKESSENYVYFFSKSCALSSHRNQQNFFHSCTLRLVEVGVSYVKILITRTFECDLTWKMSLRVGMKI